MTRWMSVDPGLRYTGWACWLGTRLVKWGLITAEGKHKALEWTERAAIMADRVRSLAGVMDPRVLVCEFPQEMGGAGSRGDIALKSGSVRKLAAYVGMIEGRLAGRVQVVLVEPMTWKGQLPKSVTLKRVLRDHPEVAGARHDTIDAIGIGRWWNRETRKRRA